MGLALPARLVYRLYNRIKAFLPPAGPFARASAFMSRE